MKENFTASTYAALSRKIEAFMENYDAHEWPLLTIITEKISDPDDPAGYSWRATIAAQDAKEAMKELLCEEHEIIRHFWCKDDIRSIETGGRPFTEKEVENIARRMESTVDCQYGISWQFIDDVAQEVAWDAYQGQSEEESEKESETPEFRHIENQYTPDGQ